MDLELGTMDIILSDSNDSVLDDVGREAENCDCRHRSGARDLNKVLVINQRPRTPELAIGS
jgi:hypothetical protein